MEKLTQEVRSLVKREGIDLVGIASVENWDVPEGHRPIDILRGAKSVIVLGLRLLDSIIESEDATAYTDMNTVASDMLDQASYRLSMMLEDIGYATYPIRGDWGFQDKIGILPEGHRAMEWFQDFEREHSFRRHLMGAIPLTYAAYRAGLGTIGRSGLLITPHFGPRVLLAALITRAPLKPDEPIETNFCKDCYVCLRLCVGGAITDKGYDPVKCWRFELEHGVPVAGRWYKICSAPCLKKCPVGKLKLKYRGK